MRGRVWTHGLLLEKAPLRSLGVFRYLLFAYLLVTKSWTNFKSGKYLDQLELGGSLRLQARVWLYVYRLVHLSYILLYWVSITTAGTCCGTDFKLVQKYFCVFCSRLNGLLNSLVFCVVNAMLRDQNSNWNAWHFASGSISAINILFYRWFASDSNCARRPSVRLSGSIPSCRCALCCRNKYKEMGSGAPPAAR